MKRTSGRRGRIARAAVMAMAAVAITGCRPSTVTEAEAKGDVKWLDSEGSAAAIEALGRLADRQPAALDALRSRASFDGNVYLAAWEGVKRGAGWGSDVLHAGLQDPMRAEAAAAAVDATDRGIAAFLPDAEASLTRIAAGGMTRSLAGMIAGAGPVGRPFVERRLADKATRAAMCSGVASSLGSVDAREAFRAAPPASRDDTACVVAAVSLASTDDATMKWLAASAEPGLLGAASKLGAIDCVRLHRVWVDAMVVRKAAEIPSLTVPLAQAVTRCGAMMDGILADTLKARPDVQNAVVGAIDPFDPEDKVLVATCAALPLVKRGPGSAITKERAADALGHGCKGER